MNDLVIIGAGGHGRELFVTVTAINAVAPTWNVLGFVDDAPEHLDRVERLGAKILGPISWLEENPTNYALGIGTSSVRRVLSARVEAAGCRPTTIVHPGAHLGLDIRLDEGVVIYDRCTLTTNVSIGRHTHLNVGCTVHHDSTVGHFVQFSPGIFVNGDCKIEDDSYLGPGVIVGRGSTIHPRARVGAGAVVLTEVVADAMVVGMPAKPRSMVIE